MPKAKEQIQFNLDAVTIDDLVEFEEGNQNSVKFIRDFLGRFVKNGKGVMKHEDGIKAIGKLRIAEIPGLVIQFREAVDGLQDEAVNPTNEAESEPQ